MTTGTYISGGGHLALILGLLFGGWLGSAPPPPPETTDVSVISSEQFAALSLPDTTPETQVDVPIPEAPEIDNSQAPAPRPEDPPVAVETPEPEAPDAPDDAPDAPDALTPPDPELAEELPELVAPAPPVPDVPVVAPPADTPQPQEAPRVAPVPVPETPVSPEIADTATPRVSPDADTSVQAEEQPEAAPEEATTEIVTEAEIPASAAPSISARPSARPARRPTPEPKPEPVQTAINNAVADAVADAAPEPARPAAPTGPPLTRGEKDGLRVAVQQCWNVGSLSTDALAVTVVVAVSMGRDGKPEAGSIRMLDYRDGSDSAARQAYEAARRAIIRCGTSGYDLPAEKYEQWREVEMTFNPERMRIK